MDKIQIIKNNFATKNWVSENRKPKWPNCYQKLSPRRGPKFSPNNPKRIGPVTACSLRIIASIGHISLVSTPNCDLFEALESRFLLKVDIIVLPCTLHNFALCSHISLILTPNFNPLKPLDSWLPRLQIHIWLVPRNYREVVPILSSSQHHCATMDLKQRNSKFSSFFFNHHWISKRTFKIPSFLLGHHRWMKKKTEIFTTIKNSMPF